MAGVISVKRLDKNDYEAYKDLAKKLKNAQELLLDVLHQACANNDGMIDDRCMKTYEDACSYLVRHGFLERRANGRIYGIICQSCGTSMCEGSICGLEK